MPSWDHMCKWHCRKVSVAECLIQTQPNIFKWNRKFVPGRVSLFFCLSWRQRYFLIIFTLKTCCCFLAIWGPGFTQKIFLAHPLQSYFHLGLRLLFSLLHYLLEFICDHFRRECLSSCTAQVHAHLHICTVKNNLPVTGSLRPHLRIFSWEFSFWGISVTCQLCMIIVQ